MIDGVKIFVSKRDDFVSYVEQSKIIDLKSSINVMTGEMAKYPLKGKFFNMDVVINPVTAYLNGSIHKLNNLMKNRGNQNFDDFNFTHLSETVIAALDTLKIWNFTSMSHLEFGFNIMISKNPKLLIHENFLMFNYADHNKDLNFRGNGKQKEFHMTDYSIKVYDKSKQNKLKENLLRVEIRILSKRLLEKLGVFKLEDVLEAAVLESIYNQLITELNKCIIVDDYSLGDVDLKTIDKLNLYTNPNFWKRIKNEKSPKQVYLLKKNFQFLIRKYSLDSLKQEILKKCDIKFHELMAIDPNQQRVA